MAPCCTLGQTWRFSTSVSCTYSGWCVWYSLPWRAAGISIRGSLVDLTNGGQIVSGLFWRRPQLCCLRLSSRWGEGLSRWKTLAQSLPPDIGRLSGTRWS